MSNRFATAPRIQRTPAFCKKVPPPPILPSGCPLAWPQTTHWIIIFAVQTTVGIWSEFIPFIITGPGTPDWVSSTTGEVVFQSLVYETLFDFQWIADPTSCNYAMSFGAVATRVGKPDVTFSSFKSGVYQGDALFAWAEQGLTTPPWEGNLTYMGSQ